MKVESEQNVQSFLLSVRLETHMHEEFRVLKHIAKYRIEQQTAPAKELPLYMKIRPRLPGRLHGYVFKSFRFQIDPYLDCVFKCLRLLDSFHRFRVNRGETAYENLSV